MPEGTVKWFNQRKGYGFLSAGDGREIFVHYSQFKGETAPHEGQAVTFDVRDSDRGPEAVNVHLLS